MVIDQEAARADIRKHIDRIFNAFSAGDLETIREAHTREWSGFMLNSRQLVRSRDEYMLLAEQVVSVNRGLRYEMLEFEVQFVGETALVFYVARDWLSRPDESEFSIVLRALDVYVVEDGRWNQRASNICIMPEEIQSIVPTDV